jgi:hypothetical protein
LIVGQPKNWRKFHASANQIPESTEIMIFSRKIPAPRARSPPETCLKLSFRVFSLVLIVGQPKKPRNSKTEANQRELVWGELVKAKLIDAVPVFEGSELREDQSSCAKKLSFHRDQSYLN